MYINLICSLYFFFVNSMERILERYERYSYADKQLVANDQAPNVSL